MNKQSLMQLALQEQWEQLPQSLQAHYQLNDNIDSGILNIEYPRFMQPILTLLRIMGVLINRSGRDLPTTVEKKKHHQVQYWKRSIHFPGGNTVLFNTYWVHARDNKLIEYVNPFLGLKMAVKVDQQNLYYEGENFIFKLGRFLIPIPEWLLLGHTTIHERAIDENNFQMDFRLQHPLFGQIFRYSGTFSTNELAD